MKLMHFVRSEGQCPYGSLLLQSPGRQLQEFRWRDKRYHHLCVSLTERSIVVVGFDTVTLMVLWRKMGKLAGFETNGPL